MTNPHIHSRGPPLLKQLAMNAQKYFQTKLHCLVTAIPVKQFSFSLRQIHQRVKKLSCVATIPCTTALLATPLPRLQNADRNRTSVCYSGLIRHHHYSHYVLILCVKKRFAHSKFSGSSSLSKQHPKQPTPSGTISYYHRQVRRGYINIIMLY